MPRDQLQRKVPQAFLWDLDGSLLESEHLWFDAEVQTMAAFGTSWTLDDQRHCLGGPLERVAEYMANKIGADVSEDIAANLLTNIENLMATTPARWCAGSIELLTEIRQANIPMALVTASHRRLVDALDHALDRSLRDILGSESSIFEVTVAGDEVDHSKPHPDPYFKAAALLGVSISDCVVIEDSPTGIAAAVASGAFVVAVPSLPGPAHVPWGLTVPSLDDVNLSLIQGHLRESSRPSDKRVPCSSPEIESIGSTH
jgi:beta-phosphoglucomutase-like phosphatase (HAD superfamily)